MYSRFLEASLCVSLVSYVATSEAFLTGYIRTSSQIKHETHHFAGSCTNDNIEQFLLEENVHSFVETNRRGMISRSLKSLAALSLGLSGGQMQEASAAYNNRLGGLPNKIRGISLVMVSFIFFIVFFFIFIFAFACENLSKMIVQHFCPY